MVRAACSFAKQGGGRCRSFALESGLCFWHDPAHETEAAEARRLGGLRRRKEKAVEGAYDIAGLEDVGQVRRLIEIAAFDTLSLENSIARSRTLAYLAGVALKALEAGEFEDRLRSLEETVQPRAAGAGRRRR